MPLTSGRLPPNPAELLCSDKMARILEYLGEQADLIVLDSPPVLAVTDAAVLASRVDGVLLVVRPGVTRLAACKQAVEQLRRGGANLLGVVLNGVDIKRNRTKYGYYPNYYEMYYRYYNNEEAKATPGSLTGRTALAVRGAQKQKN